MKLAENAPRLTITRTWQEPVTQRERLGSIPSDDYESTWWPGPYYGSTMSTESSHYASSGNCEMGNQDVYREVPVYGPDGKPTFETVTKTLSEDPYSANKSGWISAATGAALGGLAGGGLRAILGGASPATLVGVVLAGAAAGGAAGLGVGRHAVKEDTVVETWNDASVVHPRLVGYRHEIDPDTYTTQECHTEHKPNGQTEQSCQTVTHLRGYEHNYYPIIEGTKVGDYRFPSLQHTSKLSPALSAVISGAIGAGAGAGLALLARSFVG